MTALRLLVVEDQLLFRAGLRTILEEQLPSSIVHETATAKGALEALARSAFDLLLTDLRLPDRDGLWLLQRLRRDYPQLPVLVVTMHEGARVVNRAFEVGASGYLLKTAEPSEFLTAVESLLQGRQYLYPSLEGLTQQTTSPPRLSLSSVELLNLARQDPTPEVVREQLQVSQPTFNSMLRSVYARLEATDLTAAVARALELGLLVDDAHGR